MTILGGADQRMIADCTRLSVPADINAVSITAQAAPTGALPSSPQQQEALASAVPGARLPPLSSLNAA